MDTTLQASLSEEDTDSSVWSSQEARVVVGARVNMKRHL